MGIKDCSPRCPLHRNSPSSMSSKYHSNSITIVGILFCIGIALIYPLTGTSEAAPNGSGVVELAAHSFYAKNVESSEGKLPQIPQYSYLRDPEAIKIGTIWFYMTLVLFSLLIGLITEKLDASTFSHHLSKRIAKFVIIFLLLIGFAFTLAIISGTYFSSIGGIL